MRAFMSQLYQIVYTSRSNFSGSPPELEVQIRRILASARKNNREAALSGAMAFNEGWFAQVLEGSMSDLARIFGRIRSDSRHCELKILRQVATKERLFPTWSMAYADAPDGQGRHPLAHFEFESALTQGSSPAAQKLLDALCRTVVAGDKLAKV
jgi:Sensors of blue-light using FAD